MRRPARVDQMTGPDPAPPPAHGGEEGQRPAGRAAQRGTRPGRTPVGSGRSDPGPDVPPSQPQRRGSGRPVGGRATRAQRSATHRPTYGAPTRADEQVRLQRAGHQPEHLRGRWPPPRARPAPAASPRSRRPGPAGRPRVEPHKGQVPAGQNVTDGRTPQGSENPPTSCEHHPGPRRRVGHHPRGRGEPGRFGGDGLPPGRGQRVVPPGAPVDDLLTGDLDEPGSAERGRVPRRGCR